jgi:hypothetical protein
VLEHGGEIVEADFSVATTMTYLLPEFLFQGSAEQGSCRMLIGSAERKGGRQINTGRAIPVRLKVERLGNNGGRPFLTMCSRTTIAKATAQTILRKSLRAIRLEPGRYRVRVEALENIPDLEGIPVHFDIHVPGNQ